MGAVLPFLAAHLSARGEAMTSPVFSGGATTGLSMIAIGTIPALVYWAIAGRRAGWRSAAEERTEILATEAFKAASVSTHFENCWECLLVWSALGLLLFMVLAAALIGMSGVNGWLLAETEAQGRAVLRASGQTWATFKVEGSRGVIEGLAPDDVQRRAAYDSVREALDSVTGLPGILAKIENEAVAQTPMAEMTQQLADAGRREREAKQLIEDARNATKAALAAAAEARLEAEKQAAAEAEARRKAEEKALAVEAEANRRAGEQAADADARRRAEEKVLAAEADAQRKEAALAAETEAKRQLEERAQAAEERARQTAAVEPAPQVEVAAAEEIAAHQEPPTATPPAGGDGSEAPIPTEPVSRTCTSQDQALVESSSITFENQRFDITADYDNELDRLAASAQACAPRPLLVSGRADVNRDSLFNPALGLQRAKAVRDSLVARGVPATVVLTAAVPAIDDANSTDRTLNRVAKFKFLELTDISRDATKGPDERAASCESDLTEIMAHSIIHFPTASARISADSWGLIRKLASAVQTCGSVIVTVEGHTDRTGSNLLNQGLSESRASAVREALVSAGADPTRLASRGFASARPYDPGETPAAFALNRRIEFRVSGKFSAASNRGP